MPTSVINEEGSINMIYDAEGNMYRRTVNIDGITNKYDYIDGLEFINGKLSSAQHEEGRLLFDADGEIKYDDTGEKQLSEYYIADHLGNTRVFFSDKDGDGVLSVGSEDFPLTPSSDELTQQAHYYPFGLTMEGDWTSAQTPKDHHGYNGIENFAESGINISFVLMESD